MNRKNPPQRKTTLKWNSNGELSEIDMLRILEKLSSSDLNQCELTCDSDHQMIFSLKFLTYQFPKVLHSNAILKLFSFVVNFFYSF